MGGERGLDEDGCLWMMDPSVFPYVTAAGVGSQAQRRMRNTPALNSVGH